MSRLSKERRTKRARERFAENDPLRYLHVIRTDRTDEDVHDPPDVDVDWYIANPGEDVDPQ
jgi:hypothetical protein